MIAYTTIGTRDMDKACAFYDALLSEIGCKQLFGMDRIKFYGPGEPMGMPGTARPATAGLSRSRRWMSAAGTWPSIR